MDVNDTRHRYHLIKPQSLAEIETAVGCSIVVRGKYYPDRSLATERDPPLCLDVSAPSQAVLDAAVARINELKEHGAPPAKYMPSGLTGKAFAPFDPDSVSGINFRAKILGPQGSFLRHIQNESGVKAHLRGRGSGYVEIGQREESMEPLHILIVYRRLLLGS